mgnify:CR=1 FL=1
MRNYKLFKLFHKMENKICLECKGKLDAEGKPLDEKVDLL